MTGRREFSAAAGRAVRRLAPQVFLACLALCAASGALLALQYRPVGNVLRNVEEITTLAPYGWFIRRLHYASGQACALLALCHAAQYFWRRAYRRTPLAAWLRLGGGLAVCLLFLLTGFILKADAAAVCAGTVLRTLAGAVPLAGGCLANLAVAPGEGFFFMPWLHHCLTLPLALGLLLRGHVRNWLPDARILAGAAVALGIWALAAPLPLPAMPPAGGAEGPWFFLGLQELLRITPMQVGGLALPGLYLALFCALPAVPRALQRTAHHLLLAGAAAYVALGLKAVLA